MKSKTTILTLYLLLSLLLSFELIELAITLRQTRTEEQNFLPMVYENQIYQGSVTDGMTIHCVKFLSEIIHRNVSQPVLVFRYSGLSCHSCVQTSIIALRKQFPDFEKEKRIIVVLSEATTIRPLSGSLILDNYERLGYDLEESRVPHFFVFDPVEQKIIHTYIPDQTDANALKVYLETICNRYGI